MSQRVVYLFVVLRPMDEETLSQLLEQLEGFEQQQGGYNGTADERNGQ